jgi:UDPglucose--hexose-1-phosphate uridylyltransferase
MVEPGPGGRACAIVDVLDRAVNLVRDSYRRPVPPPAPHPAGPYRRDPLTGDLVRVVAARQHRPNLPAAGCPFCPGGEAAPAPYEVRWFPNHWPALPDDMCEVILYSPEHDATFASLGTVGARRVVDLWADRSATLGARPDVAYVLVFENRGVEVGATITHPHGQIYAFDVVPPRARAELHEGDAEAALGPAAPGAEDERLVAAAGAWRAWVPWAAAWPYALVMAPRHAVPDLPSLADAERDGLATILVDVLGRLDRLFGASMPYMLWIHQRPFDGRPWPSAWLHVHVAPYLRAAGTPRFVAAGELGSGVLFNPVEPAGAAAALRGA